MTEKRALDNNRDNAFTNQKAKAQLVIDLGSFNSVEHWRIYNSILKNCPDRKDHFLKDALLFVLKNPTVDLKTMKESDRDEYIAKDENWKLVASISEAKKVMEASANIVARYWKLDIKATEGGTDYDAPQVAEVQILGNKLDSAKFEQSLKAVSDAREKIKTELKDTKTVLTSFEEKLKEATAILEAAKVTQADLDTAADKLAELAKDFSEMPERRVVAHKTLEEYRKVANNLPNLMLRLMVKLVLKALVKS
ncbi:hypothetical protein ACVRY7_03515 [Streptococcus ictaluri]|uniref:Uncharacterized protein n=1 Tax=Streptococcus ictaluri 707-05 TaxID=764299 RepID=G5K5R0_9STRE|nr:hypothetical protein [Streptococcus ictaluri]EHI68544.1 hypothetical protein STRIC_0397 [Streptococcus ictaluri 707-05]